MIELVYDDACPNVDAARALIREAQQRRGLAAQWQEWRIDGDELPDHARGYGSPSIFVNGIEVTGERPGATDACCRIYRIHAGADARLRGVPELSVVLAALADAS